MNKIHTGERIKKVMTERNLKQVDIIKMADKYESFGASLKKSDLSQYVNGKTEPYQAKLHLLAKVLDVSEGWLMGLDVPRERQEVTAVENKIKHPNDVEESYTISIHGYLSAGTGAWNGDKIHVVDEINVNFCPVPHDLCFQVQGKSMFPTFDNDELVFVKKTTDVYSGNIIAVEINDEAFIKKVYFDKQKMRLVSLNSEMNSDGTSKYPDIFADINDSIYIIGKVLI